MKRLLATLLGITLTSACVAPGSLMGRIAFSGQISGASDNLALEVTLPKHYGLGGLDLVMNEAEDFGHKDQTMSIEVKAGSFSHEFPPLVYHITFWLLPPLGAFPRHPPAPVYVVRFSNAPNEVYLVGMDGDDFRYEVYAKTTREKMKHEEAAWQLSDGDYVSVDADEKEVWHLKIQAKPNKALQPTPLAFGSGFPRSLRSLGAAERRRWAVRKSNIRTRENSNAEVDRPHSNAAGILDRCSERC